MPCRYVSQGRFASDHQVPGVNLILTLSQAKLCYKLTVWGLTAANLYLHRHMA